MIKIFLNTLTLMYFVWTFVFGGPVDLTDTQRKLLGVQENGWLSLSNALLIVYSSLMIDTLLVLTPQSPLSLSLSLSLSLLYLSVSLSLFPSFPLLLSMLPHVSLPQPRYQFFH